MSGFVMDNHCKAPTILLNLEGSVAAEPSCSLKLKKVEHGVLDYFALDIYVLCKMSLIYLC